MEKITYHNYIEIPNINIYSVGVDALKPSEKANDVKMNYYYDSLQNNILLSLESYIIIIDKAKNIIFNNQLYYFYNALKIQNIRIILEDQLLAACLAINKFYNNDSKTAFTDNNPYIKDEFSTKFIKEDKNSLPFVPDDYEAKYALKEIERNLLKKVNTVSLRYSWNYPENPRHIELINGTLKKGLISNFPYYKQLKQKGLNKIIREVEDYLVLEETKKEKEKLLKDYILNLEKQRLDHHEKHIQELATVRNNKENIEADLKILGESKLTINRVIADLKMQKTVLEQEISNLNAIKVLKVQEKEQAFKDSITNKSRERSISFDEDI